MHDNIHDTNILDPEAWTPLLSDSFHHSDGKRSLPLPFSPISGQERTGIVSCWKRITPFPHMACIDNLIRSSGHLNSLTWPLSNWVYIPWLTGDSSPPPPLTYSWEIKNKKLQSIDLLLPIHVKRTSSNYCKLLFQTGLWIPFTFLASF